VVRDGQDFYEVGGEAIGDCVGKPAENVATQTVSHGPAFGPAGDEAGGGAHSTEELVAQAQTVFFVPEDGASQIAPGRRGEANWNPNRGAR
jgi:hypothetical protein